MCGICGIAYADRRRPIDPSPLLAMRDALLHRGPDDAGSYVAAGIGEIYNYRELRRGLESKGWLFRSKTDTEVLLALYAVEGESMLDRVNGMFAFAVWDAERATLFAARDRLGVKPFYYRQQSDALYFASEEKALFAAGIPADFDGDT